MLIFCNCIGLNQDNYQKLKTAYVINNKNNLIKKVDSNDPKFELKQLKREK